MQITIERDQQRIEKLHKQEKTEKKYFGVNYAGD